MSFHMSDEEKANWRTFQEGCQRQKTPRYSESRKTPDEKVLKVRRMILDGESKNQIRKHAHVGIATIEKVKRALVQEGML